MDKCLLISFSNFQESWSTGFTVYMYIGKGDHFVEVFYFSWVTYHVTCLVSPAAYRNNRRSVRNGGGWKTICSMPQKVTLTATKPREIDRIKNISMFIFKFSVNTGILTFSVYKPVWRFSSLFFKTHNLQYYIWLYAIMFCSKVFPWWLV